MHIIVIIIKVMFSPVSVFNGITQKLLFTFFVKFCGTIGYNPGLDGSDMSNYRPVS